MQVRPLKNESTVFESLSKLVYYSYFQVNDDYYLFTYAKSRILIKIIENLLHLNFVVVKNITTNQRRFCSLRGFCLYILNLKKTGKNFEVLETNLKQVFWDEIDLIIRQKNKSKLE